mmetsp:Transcript_46257/g.72430  ORF Transcript_46257/g.72430 Transcript_46257/m.72430 type:complete len:466 (-) Transcript_46257:179-1576(-)
MRQIVHPNCVRLYEVFYEINSVILVMDKMSGGTLTDRILATEHFSEGDAVQASADVLQALQYIHVMGISHRNVHPDNLLYASSDPHSPEYNLLKVADFGVAKTFSSTFGMRTLCGVRGFQAPEIIDERVKSYGPEVDIWSFGAVLYYMLCGFLPFEDDSEAALYRRILECQLSFPPMYWFGISQDAKHLLCNMVTAKPSSRFSASKCLEHDWIAHSDKVANRRLHNSHRPFLLLRKHPLFSQISPALLQEFSSKLSLNRYEHGGIVAKAGEPQTSIFFVSTGSVHMIVNGSVIDTVNTGGHFGLHALGDTPAERVYEARAVSTAGNLSEDSIVEIYELREDDIQDMLEKYPVFKVKMDKVQNSMGSRTMKLRRSTDEIHSGNLGSTGTGIFDTSSRASSGSHSPSSMTRSSSIGNHTTNSDKEEGNSRISSPSGRPQGKSRSATVQGLPDAKTEETPKSSSCTIS